MVESASGSLNPASGRLLVLLCVSPQDATVVMSRTTESADDPAAMLACVSGPIELGMPDLEAWL
jgi:hypothetical protein